MSETLTNQPDEFETEEERHARLEKEAKEEAIRTQYMEALRKVIDTYEGRLVIWEVLSLSQMFLAPPSHQFDTYRALGRGDVGREFILDIEECERDAFSRIYQESSQRQKENE